MASIGTIAALVLEILKLVKQLFHKSEKEKRHDKLVEAHQAIQEARQGRTALLDRLLNGK